LKTFSFCFFKWESPTWAGRHNPQIEKQQSAAAVFHKPYCEHRYPIERETDYSKSSWSNGFLSQDQNYKTLQLIYAMNTD